MEYDQILTVLQDWKAYKPWLHYYNITQSNACHKLATMRYLRPEQVDKLIKILRQPTR